MGRVFEECDWIGLGFSEQCKPSPNTVLQEVVACAVFSQMKYCTRPGLSGSSYSTKTGTQHALEHCDQEIYIVRCLPKMPAEQKFEK